MPVADGFVGLEFQKSQFGTRNDISFTINIGCWLRPIDALLEKLGPQHFPWRTKSFPPAARFWHWRQRVGWLMPQKRDYWWDIDERTHAAQLNSEVINCIDQYVLPVIAHFKTTKGAVEYLLKVYGETFFVGGDASMAILCDTAGRDAECQAFIEKCKSRADNDEDYPWLDAVKAILKNRFE